MKPRLKQPGTRYAHPPSPQCLQCCRWRPSIYLTLGRPGPPLPPHTALTKQTIQGTIWIRWPPGPALSPVKHSSVAGLSSGMDAAASGSREPAPPALATTPVRAQPGSQHVYVIVEGHMRVWSYPRGVWEWMVARKCPGSCPAGLNPRWRVPPFNIPLSDPHLVCMPLAHHFPRIVISIPPTGGDSPGWRGRTRGRSGRRRGGTGWWATQGGGR